MINYAKRELIQTPPSSVRNVRKSSLLEPLLYDLLVTSQSKIQGIIFSSFNTSPGWSLRIWAIPAGETSVRFRPGERVRASPVPVRLYVSGWASTRDYEVHRWTVSWNPVYVAYASGGAAPAAGHRNDERRTSRAPDSWALSGGQNALGFILPRHLGGGAA